jgi:hypothetical protein
MLTALLVNNGTDAHVPGETSLREAVAQANTDAVAGTSDTINFDPSLAGTTILLTQGQLEPSGAGTGTITIDASSLSNPVTISGNSATRVFLVDAGFLQSRLAAKSSCLTVRPPTSTERWWTVAMPPIIPKCPAL